jgi:hypothetical protein
MPFVTSHAHSLSRCDAIECRPREGGEREHGWLPPQDLRSRDGRHGHRLDLDVGARLISVDLQEHVADAQGHALVMGDDDLDLFHVGYFRGYDHRRHPGLSCATARPTDDAQRGSRPHRPRSRSTKRSRFRSPYEMPEVAKLSPDQLVIKRSSACVEQEWR